MTGVLADNESVLGLLSAYLCHTPRAITEPMLTEMAQAGVQEREAYPLLLASLCRLDMERSARDRALYESYFRRMVTRLDTADYSSDAYYAHIRFPKATMGGWTFDTARYEPYEAFVCDDLELCSDGRVIPKLGYFGVAFEYPVVLEKGREWMLVTPNEINTMRPAIEAAFGRVLSYGLGLGYFQYMVSRKPSVAHVAVVERDPSVIRLFREHILPQFENGDKLELIQADAFDYAQSEMAKGRYDVVFTDLWHDPSDGLALWQKMKRLEKFSPQSRYLYWIEKTLRCYLPDGFLA